MSTSALQAAAIEAVEKARVENPGALLKIKACRLLRDATGAGLTDIVPAIDWALAQPRTALTRADKERAVAALAKKLAGVAENYVYALQGAPGAGDPDWCVRASRRLQAAIVRVAMARTTEDAR